MPNNEQKAGAHSSQYQIENVYVGIDEKRVREIISEQFIGQVQPLVAEAKEIASERINKFEEKLIEKFEPFKELFGVFGKPEFLSTISLAESEAVQTDSDMDYEMLSSLLLNRAKRLEDKKRNTGIKEAIKVVNEIDEETLSALTALYIYTYICIVDDTPSGYIEEYDKLLEKTVSFPLPKGEDWKDQLDVLKCARIEGLDTYKNALDHLLESEKLLFTAGIPVNSDNYEKAKTILHEAGIPIELLLKNELLDDYCRLGIQRKDSIDEIEIGMPDGQSLLIKTSEEQKNAILSVLDLYDFSEDSKALIKNATRALIENNKHVNMFMEWLDKLENAIDLTIVGKALAHANAKNKEDRFPDFLEGE